MVNEIEQAQHLGCNTVKEKTAELIALAESTGILANLRESPGQDTQKILHLLGHCLEEINEILTPYGMHTFGKSPGTYAAGRG